MNHISCLPVELLSHIFSFCDQHTQKVRIPQVCHLWDEIQNITRVLLFGEEAKLLNKIEYEEFCLQEKEKIRIAFPEERKIVVFNKEEYENLKQISIFFNTCSSFYDRSSSENHDKKEIILDKQAITSKQFLNYISNGYINLNNENVLEALYISEFLGINSLKELCEKFISDIAIANSLKENNRESFKELVKNLIETNIPLRIDLTSSDITDQDLELLKGLPLQSLNLAYCNITDQGLEHLKEMPLKSLVLKMCNRITDQGLEHLKGMPLESLNLERCNQITDKGLYHLKRMPLQTLNLAYCNKISDQGIEHLNGMPLQFLNLTYCKKITDQGLEYLKGMPLCSLVLQMCLQISDQGLVNLKEMPLQSLSLLGCEKITDLALEHLKEMYLQTLTVYGCGITKPGLKQLKGIVKKLIY